MVTELSEAPKTQAKQDGYNGFFQVDQENQCDQRSIYLVSLMGCRPMGLISYTLVTRVCEPAALRTHRYVNFARWAMSCD